MLILHYVLLNNRLQCCQGYCLHAIPKFDIIHLLAKCYDVNA